MTISDKIRIYELSRDLNLENKDILDAAQKLAISVKSKEKANHGDCVHIGRAQVGVITSGCVSPILNKNIALCRIDIGHSEIGTDLEVGKIDGHQKRIPAKIVAFPHYDPKKIKVRS